MDVPCLPPLSLPSPPCLGLVGGVGNQPVKITFLFVLQTRVKCLCSNELILINNMD